MKAQIVETYHELAEAPNGAVYKTNTYHLHFKCPGCGVICGVNTDIWRIDFATLTVSPSILHTKEINGIPAGCGWHGYLENGVWRSV